MMYEQHFIHLSPELDQVNKITLQNHLCDLKKKDLALHKNKHTPSWYFEPLTLHVAC